MMLLTKNQGSRPYGFQKDFSMFFPIYAIVKHVTPGAGQFLAPGRCHFWPQGYNLNKLGRGPLGDATHQISRL